MTDGTRKRAEVVVEVVMAILQKEFHVIRICNSSPAIPPPLENRWHFVWVKNVLEKKNALD